MKNVIADSINKINIPIAKSADADISVLWIMASCGENSDSLTFKDHTHTFFELHFVSHGSIVYGVGVDKIKIEKGQFAVIPPGLFHRVDSFSSDFLKSSVSSMVHLTGISLPRR